MRQLIALGATDQSQRLAELQREKDQVAELFSTYLNHYRPKSARSRHGVLGPAAEAVKLAAKPWVTPEQVKARAYRIHEMNQDGIRPSPDALVALDAATDTLFSLRQKTPEHLWKALSNLVLDHIYLLRRKQEAAFWAAFDAWIRHKYDTPAGWVAAWGADAWDGSPPTSFDDRRRSKGTDGKRRDLAEFRHLRESEGEAPIPVEQLDDDLSGTVSTP